MMERLFKGRPLNSLFDCKSDVIVVMRLIVITKENNIIM